MIAITISNLFKPCYVTPSIDTLNGSAAFVQIVDYMSVNTVRHPSNMTCVICNVIIKGDSNICDHFIREHSIVIRDDEGRFTLVGFK